MSTFCHRFFCLVFVTLVSWYLFIWGSTSEHKVCFPHLHLISWYPGCLSFFLYNIMTNYLQHTSDHCYENSQPSGKKVFCFWAVRLTDRMFHECWVLMFLSLKHSWTGFTTCQSLKIKLYQGCWIVQQTDKTVFLCNGPFIFSSLSLLLLSVSSLEQIYLF